jgi:hypothetical protein
LAPDWDRVKQIHNTLEETKALFPAFSTNIVHVKGHQDDHTPYADLPLEAQLNVDADAAAGAHHYHAKYQGSKTAPLLPTTKAQLHIGQHNITSHHRSAIRQAASITEFWLQTQKIHQWTPGIMVLVKKRPRPRKRACELPSSQIHLQMATPSLTNPRIQKQVGLLHQSMPMLYRSRRPTALPSVHCANRGQMAHDFPQLPSAMDGHKCDQLSPPHNLQ